MSKQKSIIDQKSLAEIIGSLDKNSGFIIRVYFNSIDKDIQSEMLEMPDGWRMFAGEIRPFVGDAKRQFIGLDTTIFFLSGYQENPFELFQIQTINTFSDTNPSTSAARATYNISADLVPDSDLPKLKLYMRRFYEKISVILKENWKSQVIEPLTKNNDEQEEAPRPARGVPVNQAEPTMASMPGIDDLEFTEFPDSQVPQMTKRPAPSTQRAPAPRQATQPQQRAQKPAAPGKKAPKTEEEKNEEPEQNDVKPDDDDLFGLEVPSIPRINDGKDVPTFKGNALRSSSK